MAWTMDPPPCKRRRCDADAADDAADTDADDELSFEPYEILAKRDAGYKLSLERAYADRRFQSTMSHIFEKYGRDFEGIGDEIDMATGDIVVDNGHLANMRNEGDVGVPVDHDPISMDDFLVHDGWELPPANKEPRDDDDDDDEDRILQGRSLNPPSHELVSTAKSPWLRQPQTSPCLSNDLFAGLNHPSFGASPLAFGLSPFAMQPWSSPSLMPPTLHPRQLMSKTPSQLPTHRYDFPVQDGATSIWAPNYRFKDNEPDMQAPVNILASLAAQPVTRLKSAKHLLPMPTAKASDDGDVDEDAIINGTRQVPAQPDSPHEHDDQLASCVPQPSEASLGPSTKKTRPRRSLAHPAVPVSSPSDKTQNDSASLQTQKRSNSSKEDKKDKGNKPAPPENTSSKRPPQRLVVQFPPLDTARRRQFETVHLARDEQESEQGSALPDAELAGADSVETKSTRSKVNGEPQTTILEECPPEAKALAKIDDKMVQTATHEAPRSITTSINSNKPQNARPADCSPSTNGAVKIYSDKGLAARHKRPSSAATATRLSKKPQTAGPEAPPSKATPIKPTTKTPQTTRQEATPSAATSAKNKDRHQAARRATSTHKQKTPLASRHDQAAFVSAAPAQGEKPPKVARNVVWQPAMTDSNHQLSDDEMPILFDTKRCRPSKKQKHNPTPDLGLVETPAPALLSLPLESPPLATRQTASRLKNKAQSLGLSMEPTSTEQMSL
ncbi:hypothetical protein CDD82_6443 [Ophiocordyceps australis]|uniref:Myb-like DNA-binding domain protein n=1 Tax=Ophiocordyceps australis TaxID=1399860 RepID=A0A2C5YS19_9HYPO|nr:hypothetical protein CDD82_6443 [Ophiocordyceps australis]